MPVRPCLRPRCPERALPGESYCRAHLPTSSTITALRGGGAAAARFRREVLARAGYRCQAVEDGERCDVAGAERLQAHHVRSLALGGDPTDADNNGVALCGPHHRRAKREALARVRRGGA